MNGFPSRIADPPKVSKGKLQGSLSLPHYNELEQQPGGEPRRGVENWNMIRQDPRRSNFNDSRKMLGLVTGAKSLLQLNIARWRHFLSATLLPLLFF